jgi:hypothetical protein
VYMRPNGTAPRARCEKLRGVHRGVGGGDGNTAYRLEPGAGAA